MKKQIDNKIKIAVSVIVNAFENDGTTVRAIRILKILKNHYDLSLITRANEKQKLEDLEDIDVVIVKPDRTKLWNLKLIPLIMKNRFNCIYCAGDWFGFITYYLFSKIYRYKLIFEAHAIFSEEAKATRHSRLFVKLSQTLEIFAIKHADYVIALSEDILRFYKKHSKNIDLIPLFIDENVFKKNKEGDKYKVKTIGMIGPFYNTHNKGFLDFIYNNLDRFDNRINFVVIGRCDSKIKSNRIVYTGYLDSIQEYVNQVSRLDAVLVHRVYLITGPYTKVIESMSCSLPVFTTPKAMVGLEHAKHGRDIFIFEENKLIDKINELIFDDELLEKIGRNARITVEKYYSKKVNTKKLIDIIESLKCK